MTRRGEARNENTGIVAMISVGYRDVIEETGILRRSNERLL